MYNLFEKTILFDNYNIFSYLNNSLQKLSYIKCCISNNNERQTQTVR